MEPQIARTLETLGDLRVAGYQLYGHCYCGHADLLDLDVLIERFGKDYVLIGETRIVRALRCSVCRRSAGQITVQPR
ncbi:MAG: hypothetical protein NXH99_12890 [Rhodobacteraceae bacterium]|nr:hypothetical protein [Paracoccaceae bacterium]